MKDLFTFLIIALINFYTYSFQGETFLEDSSKADYYFEKAEELYGEGEFDSSTYYYNLAAEEFKSEERWEECLIAKNYAGINYRYLAKLNESFNVLNDALALGLEKFGTNYNTIADIYNSLGSTYYAKGDYENAFFNYNKGLQICLELFGNNHKNTARSFHNVGLIYYWTGDIQQALQHFNKALAIWLPEGEKNSNIGNCYINLANTYYLMEDYDRAIDYDLKALEVWKAVLGEKHQYIAMSYNNLADTYETLGRFEESLNYNKEALSLRKKIWGEVHPEVAYSLKNIARLHTTEGKYDKAQIYFDSAFTIYNTLPDHPGRFEALISLAELNTKTGKYENALNNYDSVLIHTLPEALSENVNADSVNIVSTKIELWGAIAGKGDVYYEKYRSSSGNHQDVYNAFYWYQGYSDLLERIRNSIRNETSKILIGRNIFETNSKLIRTAFELYKLTNEEEYKIKAFNYSENSKSVVLANAIKESGAKKFAEIPDSLISLERSLKIDLNYLDTKIQEAEEEGTDISEILEMRKEMFDVNREYDNLIKSFEDHYPKYYKLKHETRIVSLEEIRDFLNKEEELLEYFIGDSLVYIFTIDKENFEMKSVKLPEITDLVKTFRLSLQNIDYESYLSTAEKLYTLLVQPVSNIIKGKKKIYIVPSGILNYLPFEALLTENVGNKADVDFSNLPYLINNFEVSYHYSANLLLSSAENSSLKNQSSFAGFAPVFPDKESSREKIETLIDTSIISALRSVIINNKKYSTLPETEIEVSEISELFKKSGLTGTTYTYSEANESVLKSDDITTFNCIHLATHGFINEKHPRLSGLLLSDGEGSVEDGVLYSGEIFNLNFNADLVVLSACESGLGKIVKGEGIIGLTRSFIYSGVKNIVVSLWQVADKSTSQLMIEFYKNILDGKSYSSALREAKLKLIREGAYSYPLEWSPFVLIGK